MVDVEVHDVAVEYSGGGYVVRPIKQLSLQIASGELALLLGASGSGKTTLLSALAAILRPTAGMPARRARSRAEELLDSGRRACGGHRVPAQRLQGADRLQGGATTRGMGKDATLPPRPGRREIVANQHRRGPSWSRPRR
jgi:energy-coupling factor transporter ATP-binding protein EcfA2